MIIPNDDDKEEETMKMVEENEGEVSEPDETERQNTSDTFVRRQNKPTRETNADR